MSSYTSFRNKAAESRSIAVSRWLFFNLNDTLVSYLLSLLARFKNKGK
jgi:hypothetical protein